ncbi:MAG: serine dehydratase, partial [bacterium]
MSTKKKKETTAGRDSNKTHLNYTSIINDVIVPVMRGPSSSHCAAAVRIGRMARDLMDGKFENILIEFDLNGSLATTHDSQGSDMGLFGGFLGWETSDERLAESATAIREAGVNVDISISDYGAEHPNTYKLTLKNSTERHEMVAISTGGGMIEVTEIDGVKVSMGGDYYETLIYLDSKGQEVLEYIARNIEADEILLLEGGGIRLVEIKAQGFLEAKIVSELHSKYNIRRIKTFAPVLPVLSRKEIEVPFITCEEMRKYNKGKELGLWELAVHYESARGSMSHD